MEMFMPQISPTLKPVETVVANDTELSPIVLRMLAKQARLRGVPDKDYLKLFQELATAAEVTDVLDQLAVMDVTIATFDVLWLREMRQNVIEAARERRRETLALRECTVAAMQRGVAKTQLANYPTFMKNLKADINDPAKRDAAYKLFVLTEGEPLPPENAPPYQGAYSEADVEKFMKELDCPADDGQAFIDALDYVERINDMIEAAQKSRDKAFADLLTRRRGLGERLRVTSDRIIEGKVNPQ
jgi:hypothetical protein